MKIYKFKFEEKEMIQIYITKEEEQKKEFLNTINQLKMKKINVSVFVIGEKNTISSIEEMLNYEKSSSFRFF